MPRLRKRNDRRPSTRRGSIFFFDEEYADLHWKPGEHAALLTCSNVVSPTAEAWCCRDCKKVVIDYADIPQSNLKSLF